MAYDANLLRLPDPATIPAGPGWNKQTITDKIPGMVHALNGAAVISVQNGGQYWEISIGYPELTTEEARELLAFIYGIQGAFNPFYIQLPNYANPSSGRWLVDTAVRRGQGRLTTAGLNSNQLKIDNINGLGGYLVPGDMIKLSNGDKIYQVRKVESVAGSPGGTEDAILTFNTDIIGAVDGLTELEPNDLKFRVRLQGDSPSISIDTRGLIPGISMNMRESLT